MINEESRQLIDNSRYRDHFTRPRYDSFCFARIPPTLLDLFDGRRSDTSLPPSTYQTVSPAQSIILILFDAFGRHMIPDCLSAPSVERFFARLEQQGTLSFITSQFPSTTAAHVTTLHSGLPLSQTGVYEWFYYEHALDKVIAPLLYCEAKSHHPGELEKHGVEPESFLPQDVIYSHLNERGVRSYALVPSAYCFSPYNRWITRGATSLPYSSLAEGFQNIQQLLLDRSSRKLIFLYADSFDSACHRYGPHSEQSRAAAEVFFNNLEAELLDTLPAGQGGTALILTADHGQTSIDPQQTVYLDLEMPHLTAQLEQCKNGELKVPAGSSRDFFLHVRPEAEREVLDELRTRLVGSAEVISTRELIEDGVFGQQPLSDRFLRNVGNVVILPLEGKSVYWSGQNGMFRDKFFGHHGGMTPVEMESIFAFLPLS